MARNPDDMTAAQRMAEIGAILCEGLLRLKCKKARKTNTESTISLYSSGNQSVHAPENKPRGKNAWKTTL